MDLSRVIKSLSLRQITGIVGKVIMNPLMFYCFVKATKKCIFICDTRFGKAHHKNNKANAYRHALWNMLIAHQCMKAGKNLSLSLSWAEEMTNWHEQTFVNNPLETQMDLHNNEMGRLMFGQMHQEGKGIVAIETIEHQLLEEVKKAHKISKKTLDRSSFKKKLIFIDES